MTIQEKNRLFEGSSTAQPLNLSHYPSRINEANLGTNWNSQTFPFFSLSFNDRSILVFLLLTLSR